MMYKSFCKPKQNVIIFKLAFLNTFVWFVSLHLPN